MIPLGILASAGAAAAPAFELISTTNLSNSASSVTISSIPSTYRHLQLRAVVKETNNSFDYMVFRFNGDSGNNYARHMLRGNGGGVFSSANATLSNGFFGVISDVNDGFSATIADILDYASTSKNKTVRSFSGQHANNPLLGLFSGLWMNTGVINSITITSNNGNATFQAGSRFSLYGIRG